VAVSDGRAYTASDNGWVYCLGNTPLSADFDFEVDLADVTLNDTTSGKAAYIVDWEWDVPGKDPFKQQNLSFRLTASGEYNITLTVFDEFGRESTVTKPILIDLPELLAGFTFNVDGKTVTFLANDTAFGLEITGFSWIIEGIGQLLEGRNITYTFETPGEYEVTLTVEDELGRESQFTLTITVEAKDDGDGDGDDTPGPGALAGGVALLLTALVMVAGRRRK
jgi:PKD repeat protein